MTARRPIRKLLVANRGEIACRIMRTASRMGMATIAVHSEADRTALHVRIANEAMAVGPAPAAQSYLNIGAIIGAARKTGADAIHPGYGFLSENAEFAQACADAGVIFVGPSPESIRVMGDKSAAKARVIEAGVPVVPGYQGEDQSDEGLAREAEGVGYPLLIKAAAGGGGRGMRLVREPAGFGEALASARREARAAFGDDRVLLERFLAEARHVEVQVFGDRHGNIVHLFERDCSTQRRHQKIIEECPSPIVDEALRERLGQWAVAVAANVRYEGAGTVEFIVDGKGDAFFLEMNTRLQVEHPVTEMVTGVDLVEWQLRVAAGEALPLAQRGIRLQGHAIEVRLCLEDPGQGFLPQAGRVLRFARPDDLAARGLRIDSGIEASDEIGGNYDSLVAKHVAHGASRHEAAARLARLLEETPLVGIANNGAFLARVLATPQFLDGQMTTATVDAWIAEANAILAPAEPCERDFVAAAAITAFAPGGSWFRSTGVAEHPVTLECRGRRETVRLAFRRGRLARASICGHAFAFEAADWDGEMLTLSSDGREQQHRAVLAQARLHLLRGAEALVFAEPDPFAGCPAADDPGRPAAPASGRVSRVAVDVGERVEPGAVLVVIEAMKMETTVASRAAGQVRTVNVRPGDQVQAGEILVEIESR